jgi:hypothetical protein
MQPDTCQSCLFQSVSEVHEDIPRPHERLDAHARRRRWALGAAAGVGAVGVGVRELGADARHQLLMALGLSVSDTVGT